LSRPPSDGLFSTPQPFPPPRDGKVQDASSRAADDHDGTGKDCLGFVPESHMGQEVQAAEEACKEQQGSDNSSRLHLFSRCLDVPCV